jgi:hypothetical protein
MLRDSQSSFTRLSGETIVMRVQGPSRLVLLLFLYVSGTAAFAASEADIGRVLADESSLPAVKLDRMDLDRLSAEDAVRDELPVPKRFAVGHDVRVTPSTHGRWQQLADGRWQWRHAVRSPDAVHLNFGFAKFVLPDGAKLTIVSPDSRDALGPWGCGGEQAARPVLDAGAVRQQRGHRTGGARRGSQ